MHKLLMVIMAMHSTSTYRQLGAVYIDEAWLQCPVPPASLQGDTCLVLECGHAFRANTHLLQKALPHLRLLPMQNQAEMGAISSPQSPHLRCVPCYKLCTKYTKQTSRPGQASSLSRPCSTWPRHLML